MLRDLLMALAVIGGLMLVAGVLGAVASVLVGRLW